MTPDDRPPFVPPLVGGQPVSPVHFSSKYGVHADIGNGSEKQHVPFEGQTTIPTFGRGEGPGKQNDEDLADLGGTLHNEDISKQSSPPPPIQIERPPPPMPRYTPPPTYGAGM